MLRPGTSEILRCFFSAKKIVWLFHAKTKFCVFFRGTMSVIIFFVVQLVLYVSKRNSAVRFSQIETKRSYLTIGKAQLNACAVSDGVEEQKSCLGLGDIKTVITFPLYNFLIPNLAGCFVTAIATVCDFYIFPIVGIGAVNFQSKKNRQSTLVFRCFSLQKKWKNFFISIFINYTIWLTFVWRICVSIVQGFPPRAFLKQRLAHSSASAKTIPAFSHQAAATNIRWTWGKLVKGQRDSAEQAKGLEECLWRSGH